MAVLSFTCSHRVSVVGDQISGMLIVVATKAKQFPVAAIRRVFAVAVIVVMNGELPAMTWAQRLKRVFRIDIETCEFCGTAVRVIAPAHRYAPLN